MNIIWLRKAASGLDEIYDYLAEKSPLAASKFYNKVLDDVEKLASSPKMAPLERYLDDRPEGFRSLLIRKTHKVIYYLDGDLIKVVFIWDCRRNPQTLREFFTGKRG